MVGSHRPSRAWVLFVAALSPLVFLPILLSTSVDPLARVGATLLGRLRMSVPSIAGADAPRAPLAAGEPFASVAPEPEARRQIERRASDASRSRGRRRFAPAGRNDARRIYVGADSIRRAVPASGRPIAAWVNGGDEHPAGLIISQPGALSGMIRAGDIL